MANGDNPAQALRECDIIMRGGITSGVVYPGVLAGLARHYRFRNVGGASAGAIAAAVAAAAEYGRQNPPEARPDFDPFDDIVSKIPDQIGGAEANSGGTSMQRLFQAHGDTAQWAALLWLWLDGARWRLLTVAPMLLLAMIVAASVVFCLVLALLAGPAVVLMPVSGSGFIGSTPWWIMVFVAQLFGMAASLIPVFRLAPREVAKLRNNGFGLAGGINPALANVQGDDDAAMAAYISTGGFADWLHATVQKCAGRSVTDTPLLMRDLWGSGDPLNPQRNIDLLLTTTNLSQQLPHQFPFLERTQSYLYFRRDDLARVLPAPVVDYLVAKAGEAKAFAISRDGVDYLRLPRPADLPVLLGVRMSLSFPGLISALRLYETRGFSRTPSAGDREDAIQELRPCWFSDGGITSNFPVSSFDSMLPLRPTFCISLADLPDGADPDGFARVDLAERNSDAIRAPHLNNLDRADLLGFAGAIVDTARNGHENELVTMPGHRDRIVTIFLDPKSEGGLNLAMPATTIGQLAGYGTQAADELIKRFGKADATQVSEGWDNHRWVRMRASLAALERLLVGFDQSWGPTRYQQLSYAELIERRDNALPSYKWEGADLRERAVDIARQIAELANAVNDAAPDRPDDTVFNGRIEKTEAGSRRKGNAPLPVVRLAFRPAGSDPRA